MSIFANLADSLKTRKAKAVNDYSLLVSALVAEKKVPDVAAIEVILKATDKTVADLEGDVKKSKRRNDLRAQIALSETLQAERPAIDEQIAKAKTKLASAQETHDAAMLPLRQRIEAISSASYAAGLAEAELRNTMPEDFYDRSAELESAVRQTDSQCRSAQKHLSEVESRLNSAELRNPQDASEIDEYREQVANGKSRLAACQDAATSSVDDQASFIREMMAL